MAAASLFVVGKREDDQQARAFFSRLETGRVLSEAEAAMLRTLSSAPTRVRRQVLALAFSDATNAMIALPRFGLLLQACDARTPMGAETRLGQPDRNILSPTDLWRNIINPAIKKRPSIAVFRLGLAAADLLSLGTNEVSEIASPLLKAIHAETNRSLRLAMTHELGAVADRMRSAEAKSLADVLVSELGEETDPHEIASQTAALVLAVARLETGAAQMAISQALQIMESMTNAAGSLALAEALSEFAGMRGEQMERTVQGLAREWVSNGRASERLCLRIACLARQLTPEQQQAVITQMLSKSEHRDLFYQDWATNLSLVLKACVPGMGKERAFDLVRQWIAEPALPFTDLFYGRITAVMVSEAGSGEVQPLMKELVARFLRSGQPVSGHYAARFSALADRLNAEDAQHWVDVILPRLLEPDVGPSWDPLVGYLAALSGRLDVPALERLAMRLDPAMIPVDTVRVLGCAKILAPAAAKLAPATADRMIDRLFATMGERKNIFRVSTLAGQLTPYAERVKPEQLQPVLDQIVGVMEETKDADSIRVLVAGLAPFAEQLSPAQAARVGEGLIRAIETEPLKVFGESKAVGAVARHIKPEQSQRAVDWLLQRGLNRAGPDSYFAFTCAPIMAAGLTPEMAEALARKVILPLGRQSDLPRICRHVRAAAPLADQMHADQVRRVGEELVDLLEGGTNNYGFEALLVPMTPRHSDRWTSPRVFIAREESTHEMYAVRTVCEALARLLPKMEKGDAADVAARVAVCLAEQSMARPIPFDESLAATLQYAPESKLVSVLRGPFAVGGLRQTVRRALEKGLKVKTDLTGEQGEN
jgi:hypothetical protein